VLDLDELERRRERGTRDNARASKRLYAAIAGGLGHVRREGYAKTRRRKLGEYRRVAGQNHGGSAKSYVLYTRLR